MANTLLDDEWLSLRQFCDLVGWQVGTAHNRLSKGLDFPTYYKVGKNVRIRKVDAEAWLAKQLRTTAAVQLDKQRRKATAQLQQQSA